MCHAQHPASYAQGQGHILDLDIWMTISFHISCADCIIHMLDWILILLHTIILHNKMMCHAQHPASYAQGQGHILDLNIWMTILFCISCAGCIIHMLDWILILLHTIILHNKMMCHAQHPASYAQGQGHILDLNIWMTSSFRISCAGCFVHMLDWILILLHTIILQIKMMCHAQHPASYAQGQGHILDLNIWMTISCPACIVHMLDWNLMLQHTIIL